MMTMSTGSISEPTLAFQPGAEVAGETVCRTFQPSFVVTRRGTLLAFCQGRLRNGRDDDPKAILTSRSEDQGATWSPARAVSAPITHYAMSAYLSDHNGTERISVLTLVCLRGTETLYDKDYAMMKKRTGIDIDAVGRRTAMVLCRFDSEDDGHTWTLDPLTGDRGPLNHRYADGTLLFFNPIGQVHVIPEGPRQGRYIIGGPAAIVPEHETITDYFRNHATSGSGVIYSDDQGQTWRADGMITDHLANEASAVSLHRGTELLLIRRANQRRKLEPEAPMPDFPPGPGERIAHISRDGGATWSAPFLLPIRNTICHGTLARVDQRLLFSIPAGSDVPGEKQNHRNERMRGTLYFSDDEGVTWRHKRVDEGTFSYSTVGRLSDELRIVLFGRGAMGDDGIACRVFTDEWLEA